MLAYNTLAAGGPMRSPFVRVAPSDTLGFGPKTFATSVPKVLFTPARGWQSVAAHAVLTSFWCAGGLVLILVALWAFVSLRPLGPLGSLLLGGAALVVGHFFFWAGYNALHIWGAPRFIGPYYFMPLLIPILILGARGLDLMWRWDRRTAIYTVFAMALASTFVLALALRVNLQLSAEDRRLYDGTTDGLGASVVFVPSPFGNHLLHPFAGFENSASYEGRIVYALDQGDRRNLDVLADYPDRDVFFFHVHGRYRVDPPDPRLEGVLEHGRVVTTRSFTGPLLVDNPLPGSHMIVTVSGADSVSARLHERSTTDRLVLHVASQGAEVAGADVMVRAPLADRGFLTIQFAVAWHEAGPRVVFYRRKIAYERQGDVVRMLLPGQVTARPRVTDPFRPLFQCAAKPVPCAGNR
jgi:hypothetical protein